MTLTECREQMAAKETARIAANPSLKMKPTAAMLDSVCSHAFSVNIGYSSITPAGLFSFYGYSMMQHWQAGGIILVRVHRNGIQASWTHGCGVNAQVPSMDDAYWLEVECHGDPMDGRNWKPTGKAWVVGGDIHRLKVECGIVDCVRGVSRNVAV